MARYVSFALLLAVTVFVCFAFYKVMAGFLVPLFLAALLVVIFSPFYRRLSERLSTFRYLAKNRRADQTSALLTTVTISLLVLVPLAILITLATQEARVLVATTNTAEILNKLKQARKNLNLELPAAGEIRDLEQLFQLLRENAKTEELQYQRQLLFEIQEKVIAVAANYDLEFYRAPSPPASDENETPSTEDLPPTPNQSAEVRGPPAAEEAKLGDWQNFCLLLTRVRRDNSDLANSPKELEGFHVYLEDTMELENQYRKLKSSLLLGQNGWLKELLNPSEDTLLEYGNKSFQYARDRMFEFGSASTAFVGKLLVGTAIMLFAFFFFLLDGRAMIESLKGLSPLDDMHEQELVDEFSKVSRAVVLATLLSAIAQGILAAFGYYFVGLDSVFLLMMLTSCLALVPFVGAAAVWFPCCLYLYFMEGSLLGAVGLGIYGVLVISMADNFIKPLVLHGQSNIHPLFAFLSIIGGVGALGPIGLLIGPMVVAFLQTLLKIFQEEIGTFDQTSQQKRDRDRLRRFQREPRPFPTRRPQRSRPSSEPRL